MKLFNALLANVLLAGGLLAVPALAADKTDTISSGTRTDVIAEGPGGGEGHGDWHKPHFTDDQLIQMAALKDKYFSSTASQKTQLMSLHRQLRGALAKSDINRSEVLSLQSQMNTIHDDLANKKMNEKLDFIALLTPEQKEHFRHHMLVANAFGGHKMGHHGGGCGGGGGMRGGHHHHHKMGQGGPGVEQPRVGFEGDGPGPVAFDGPGQMGPEAPDAE
ncbi:MAG TPA: Spy/CpxP family protein refolding chaperone [Drouetiella sp.]